MATENRLVEVIRDGLGNEYDTVVYEKATDEEFILALIRKLGDAAFEYAIEGGLDELVEVFEALQALIHYRHEVSWDSFAEMSYDKKMDQGGFDRKRAMFIQTEDEATVEEVMDDDDR